MFLSWQGCCLRQTALPKYWARLAGKVLEIMGLATANQNMPNLPGDWWHSLPFSYQNLELFTDSRPIGFRFNQYIVNIKADFRGTRFLVCGEDDSQELAITKAIAELLERTAMKSWIDENPSLKIENSNGFAAHSTIELARENAIFERVERDAVLAQWYTATPFLQIESSTLPVKLRAWLDQELSHSEFPILKILISTQGLGPSVTCLLMNQDGFGVSGHSAKPNIQDAVDSAIAEACRAAHHYLRRSFWDDSIFLKEESTDGGPRKVAPGAHALYYAYHEPFPAWMFGDELSWDKAKKLWENRVQVFSRTAMTKFSFQDLLEEPLAVGFAHSPECFDLIWGPCRPSEILLSRANRRFASPINERTLNRKPHIVA